MDDNRTSIARRCLEAAEANTLTFPQIVATLMDAGFESYAIDFRRALATYYLPDGDAVALPTRKVDVPVAPAFDAGPIQGAVKDAQRLAPGYSYEGFCRRVAAAGCAGYIVSFSGRRAVYIGRTADTHVEHFPS